MSEPEPVVAPETGDARVDEALAGVAGLDAVPVDEHADRLSAAHGALQEVLRTPADRDTGPSSVRRP